MRNCYCLDKSLKQRCETDLGGIDKIYLLNAQDFLHWDFDNIEIREGAKWYEIDFANNMAQLTMEAIHNGDASYILSTLTFVMRFETVNLEDALECLQLGYFKALIRYKNGYWRFLDEDELNWFKNTSLVHDSGQQDGDMNNYTFSYEMHGHTWGLVYEKKPTTIFDEESTEPNWVIFEEECEEANLEDYN